MVGGVGRLLEQLLDHEFCAISSLQTDRKNLTYITDLFTSFESGATLQNRCPVI